MLLAAHLLRNFVDATHDEAATAILFKGIAATAELYDSLSDRAVGDVDFVTSAAGAGRIIDALIARRWRIHPPEITSAEALRTARREGRIYNAILLGHPTLPGSIDLHWDVGPPGVLRGGVAALLAESRRITIAGMEVSVLSERDTVVVTALYVVRDFFVENSLKLANDLDRAIAKWFPERFDEVIAHARTRGLLRCLHAAAAFGASRLDAPRILPRFLRALPADPDAEKWQEWMPRWPETGPAPTPVVRALLRPVHMNHPSAPRVLLYPLFADGLPRQIGVAAQLGRFLFARRITTPLIERLRGFSRASK